MSDSELAVVAAQTFPAPILIANVGPEGTKRFFEFFTVPIRNAYTRAAYYRAIEQFLFWCERAGYQDLEDIEPITVAAYIETLQRQAAPPTVKQHMAAIRMMFSWLTEKGVLAMNPAREVKTERFSRTEGKTPAFVEGEVQKLLGVIETTTHTGLRDRALLGVLAYTFARIGAVVNLKVEDYYPSGKRFLLRFKEKGGKEKELPVHHKLEELLDEYLKESGLEKEPGSPLFPASIGKSGKLSRRPLVRTDAADMLKRRLKQAGLPAHYSPHSFRATGITNFLENDGTLPAMPRTLRDIVLCRLQTVQGSGETVAMLISRTRHPHAAGMFQRALEAFRRSRQNYLIVDKAPHDGLLFLHEADRRSQILCRVPLRAFAGNKR